jgi:small subunit ribosomal protein S17
MAEEQKAETAGAPVKARRRNEQVGTVVSAKMQKTVVVSVERLVRHAVYRKTIRRTSTFMAHDEKGAREGDTVRIVETRPLSRHKRWRVEEILGAGRPVEDTATATIEGAEPRGSRRERRTDREAATPTEPEAQS